MTVILAEGPVLEQRLASGTVDLVSQNPGPMQELVRSGKIVGSTVTPFQLAELGVAVKAGAPKPNIGTVEAYKAALLAAKSIGYSRGCSGTHAAQGIEKLGLTAQLKSKTVLSDGAPIVEFLAKGDFEDQFAAFLVDQKQRSSLGADDLGRGFDDHFQESGVGHGCDERARQGGADQRRA